MRCTRLFAALLFVLLCNPAPAQTISSAPAPNPLDQARIAITQGRLEQARDLLKSAPTDADANDLDFLWGTWYSACGDYDHAIERYRAVLARNPSLNRVRLDLARAFFMDGDYAVAEYHFRLAEAAGLPPQVQANVDKMMDEIKRRKKWTAAASFGLAPSTNINYATTAQTVNIYGTPYQLTQDSQKTSGVGAVGSISASYQAPMTDNTRMVVGGSANGTDYFQHDYDDNSVNAFLGPRFLIGQASEATVEATATQRWYGGQNYYSGGGARVEAKTTISPRLQIEGAVAVQQLDYSADYSSYSGPVTNISTAATYGLDAQSFVRLDAAIIHEQTDVAAYRDTQYFIGPNYYRELPQGFIGNLGVTADFAYFDAPLEAFGVTRHDTTINCQVGISNRKLNFFGFMPSVTYVHTNRYSDINLYSFSSDRAILGASQNF